MNNLSSGNSTIAPMLKTKSAGLKQETAAANNAVAQLVEAGVLQQVNVGRRNRAYEAPEIVAAFTDLERQLASPEGDTLTSKPARPVPPRR